MVVPDSARWFLDNLPVSPCPNPPQPYPALCTICIRINRPVAAVCPVGARLMGPAAAARASDRLPARQPSLMPPPGAGMEQEAVPVPARAPSRIEDEEPSFGVAGRGGRTASRGPPARQPAPPPDPDEEVIEVEPIAVIVPDEEEASPPQPAQPPTKAAAKVPDARAEPASTKAVKSKMRKVKTAAQGPIRDLETNESARPVPAPPPGVEGKNEHPLDTVLPEKK